MSVFEVLHGIQNTLAARFPVVEGERLHPYLRNGESSTRSWEEERARLLSQVKKLRTGVEQFKTSWQGRTPTDDPDAVEQKKTVLLRIMADWCTNQQSLLPVSSILNTLLARARTQRTPKTPFVQPQTLTSPTNRLVALAQSIDLEVSLDNQDPSFGMGEPASTPTGTRVDTLALAGQRMVIDVEISHPSDGDGWRVVSLRVERVDPEHLAASGGGGMDVDPAETGPRLLSRVSEVLRRYLERYLGAVNAYDEAERNWQDSEEEDGETMELKAERAVLAFGEQLRDLRAIDLQMKPLDAGEMEVDGAREERVLWDQLDELHDFVRSTPGLDIPEPTVLPSFRPFPRETFLPNPLCRLVRSDTATAAPFPTGSDSFAAWAVQIDEPVPVSQGFFQPHPAGGKGSGDKTLEELLGVESGPYTYQGPSGLYQSYLFPRQGRAGMWLDCIGIRSKEDIASVMKGLRNALWIGHLVRSCIRRENSAAERTESIDDELDMLLAGAPVRNPAQLTVILQPSSPFLGISFPLPSRKVSVEPRILGLELAPDETGRNIIVKSSEEGMGSLDLEAEGAELVRLRGDVPVWLDGLCGKLFT